MNEKGGHIAFVAPFYDPSKIVASGVEFFLLRALKNEGIDVAEFGPYSRIPGFDERVIGLVRKNLGLRRLSEKYSRSVARRQARSAENCLQGSDASVVLSCFPGPIAFLNTQLPRILYTDATMHNVLAAQYEFLESLAPSVIEGAKEIEKGAFDRSTLVICRNHWAATSVVQDYGVPEHRVLVIPAGANLLHEPPDLVDDRSSPSTNLVRLLFIGGDYRRKGGNTVVDTVRELHNRGVHAELLVVGAVGDHPEFAQMSATTRLGVLDKNIEEEHSKLDHCFRTAHYLIQPSRQEPCAIVFAEAAAYSLPVLTTDVGGVRTAVCPDVSGRILPAAAEGEDFAKAILADIVRPERYRELSQGARNRYQQELNWVAVAKRFRQVLFSNR